MAIRIKTRASVEPSFIKAYEYLAEKKLRQEQEKLTAMSKAAAEATMQRNPSMYGRLTSIYRHESGPNMGLDFEITRLRALDYTRFFALLHKTPSQEKILYMCATTPDLMIEEVATQPRKRRRRHYYDDHPREEAPTATTASWDAGAYTIYVPVMEILKGKSDGIHVVPERFPNAVNRHPHHGCKSSSGDYHLPDMIAGHFLDAKIATCWSEFGSPVLSAIGEANVVEIFRFMRIFAGRYYSGSPLRTMGARDMDFIKKVV